MDQQDFSAKLDNKLLSKSRDSYVSSLSLKEFCQNLQHLNNQVYFRFHMNKNRNIKLRFRWPLNWKQKQKCDITIKR